MAVIGPMLSASQFHYHRDTKTFTQELSSLGNAQPWGRLYDDACDEGFVLVSPWTQRKIPFYLASCDTNQEGEVHGWWFKSTDKFSPFKVLIIND